MAESGDRAGGSVCEQREWGRLFRSREGSAADDFTSRERLWGAGAAERRGTGGGETAVLTLQGGSGDHPASLKIFPCCPQPLSREVPAACCQPLLSLPVQLPLTEDAEGSHGTKHPTTTLKCPHYPKLKTCSNSLKVTC